MIWHFFAISKKHHYFFRSSIPKHGWLLLGALNWGPTIGRSDLEKNAVTFYVVPNCYGTPILKFHALMLPFHQGWEFAHQFFERFAHFLWAKEQRSNTPMKQSKSLQSLFCQERPEQIAHVLLFCHEWPEWFAHGHSLDMSDLSDSLTVANLSWAIWANSSQLLIWFEQNEGMSKCAMSKCAMSEFPALNFWLEIHESFCEKMRQLN